MPELIIILKLATYTESQDLLFRVTFSMIYNSSIDDSYLLTNHDAHNLSFLKACFKKFMKGIQRDEFIDI